MPHDFFLSYACLDNEPAIPGRPESAWVTTFCEALSRSLQFYLQREAEPFFDTSDWDMVARRQSNSFVLRRQPAQRMRLAASRRAGLHSYFGGA